jgi:hypothetical protein
LILAIKMYPLQVRLLRTPATWDGLIVTLIILIAFDRVVVADSIQRAMAIFRSGRSRASFDPSDRLPFHRLPVRCPARP